jgi:hypothetical protein
MLRADRESSALLKGGDAEEIKGGALVECKERTPRREKSYDERWTMWSRCR